MRLLRTFAVLALALAPAVLGCEEEKKPPPPWSLPAAAASAKAGPIDKITPPADVVAWGGVDSPDKLSAAASALAGQLFPIAPNVLDLFKDQLRAKMSLTRVDGVDWSKPVRVARLNIKGREETVIVLSLADKAKLLAPLPPSKKENDEGNAVTYRDDLGVHVSLNFIDEQVVIAWDKKLFGAHAEFLGALARSAIPEGQTLLLSAKNVSALYKKEIDEQIAQVKTQTGDAPWAAMGVTPEASAVGLEWMVATLKELDIIKATPRLLEDGAVLSMQLHPMADTPVLKSFQSIEAKPHTLYAKLPADAPMFASFSMNAESKDTLAARFLERILVLSLSVPAPEGSFAVTGGEIVFSVHKPVGADGLTMTTLFAVKDEDKQRAGVRAFFEPFKDKALLDKLKKSGSVIEYKTDAFKVGKVGVDTFERREEKGADVFAKLGPLGESMREFSLRQMAVSKDLGVIGHGKDAKKTIEALLGGKMPGDLDKAAGPARALKNGVKSPAGIIYLSPVEIAKRASMNGKNALADMFKDLASTTGVCLTFGVSGGDLEIVIDVPVEQAKNVMQAVTRARALFPQQ